MEALTLEALERVEKFVRERTGMRHLDPDLIHGLHTGHEKAASLLLSDMRALIAMARSSLADREDARRYRWLRDRLYGADFMYGEPAICAVIFEWPKHAPISADLDASIDAAQPPKD